MVEDDDVALAKGWGELGVEGGAVELPVDDPGRRKNLGSVPIIRLSPESWLLQSFASEVAMRRHELSDEEWSIIAPLLPNNSRGIPRVDDRRVINGILWRFQTGLSWREVPERHGPRTTLYNRFSRWRAAGVWDRLLGCIKGV